MASRWFVGNGTNWNSTASWSSVSSGGASGASVPDNTMDVFLDSNSPGNLTITAAASCQSITVTGFTHTLTINASQTLTVGGASAPPGNVSLIFPTSGWTFSPNLGNSTIKFADTSGVTNTADFGGQTCGPITIANGSTTTTQLVTNGFLMSTSQGATFTVTTGKVDFNGLNCTIGNMAANAGSLTLGAATITVAGNNWTVSSSNTFSGTSATINMTNGIGSSGLTFAGGGKTYNVVSIDSGAQGCSCALSGSNTFTSLSRTSSTSNTSDTLTVAAGTTQTITTLTVTGPSATKRIYIKSGTIGSTYTLSVTTLALQSVNIADCTAAGGANWNISGITGNSGDCLGNTGITFTTGATQYWVGNGGDWLTTSKWASSSGGSGGTGRIPLPQDDVVFDASSITSTGQTITLNTMSQTCRNWDASALAHNVTMGVSGVTPVIYGTTFTYGGASGYMINQNVNFTFALRSGTCSITCGGTTAIGQGINFGESSTASSSATFRLMDDLDCSTLANNGQCTFVVASGTLDAATHNANVHAWLFQINGTSTAQLGSGTWHSTCNDNSTFWTAAAGSTITCGTSTIQLDNTSTSTRTFAGGGKTYNNLVYTVAGSTGQLTITGSNTFTKISFKDATNARTIAFTASTTTTFTSAAGVDILGTSGKLMTVKSTTTTNATFSVASGNVSCDYLDLIHMTGAGGATFYAGANTTNGGGNTNWNFSGAPAGGGLLPILLGAF